MESHVTGSAGARGCDAPGHPTPSATALAGIADLCLTSHDVNAGEPFEREPSRCAERDVNRECGRLSLAILEADRGAAVAAASGLEAHERAVRGGEPMNHLERRWGGLHDSVCAFTVMPHIRRIRVGWGRS